MTKKMLMFCVVLLSAANASNPVCGGGCAGCAPILPVIYRISTDIKNKYRTLDRKFTEKYKTQVLEFQKAITLLEKQIAKEIAETQVLEKEILKTEEGIAFEMRKIKELESTRGLTPSN